MFLYLTCVTYCWKAIRLHNYWMSPEFQCDKLQSLKYLPDEELEPDWCEIFKTNIWWAENPM